MRVIRLTVQYDGTDFEGFQRQRRPGRPTVQATLEQALSSLTGQSERVVGAGRTDAGVHALGQVVHWRTLHPIPVERLAAALNHRLPGSVRVVAADEVDPHFHARRDATSRIYCYHILNSPVPSVFAARYAWWVPEPLDVDAMRAVVERMVGRRDFRVVGSPLGAGRSTVRVVYQARLEAQPLRDGGQVLRLVVEANAFLYRMMRLLAGLLVRVGRGHLDAAAACRALEGPDREPRPKDASGPPRLAPAAPACGLCLVYVHYGPPPAGLERCGAVLDTLFGIPLEWPRGAGV